MSDAATKSGHRPTVPAAETAGQAGDEPWSRSSLRTRRMINLSYAALGPYWLLRVPKTCVCVWRKQGIRSQCERSVGKGVAYSYLLYTNLHEWRQGECLSR